MFNKLFARPLKLNVAGQEIAFNTLAEFEFCLTGRTEVPSRKLSELITLGPDELKREAKSIKAVEKQFVDILSKAIENQESIAKHLDHVDAHVFSQDHNWRDIMMALQGRDHEYDELRRIALVKYMQYLASRQEVIKYTYSVKKLKGKSRPRDDAEAAEAAGPGALRETVILDSVVLEQPPKQEAAEFSRLPKGEAVAFPMPPSGRIEVRLSKHVFHLEAGGEGLELVDANGERHELMRGKNIIGRDTVCNVAVDSSFRDVSRMHLIVERMDDGNVRMTDLSAHGTFIPSHLLAESTIL